MRRWLGRGDSARNGPTAERSGADGTEGPLRRASAAGPMAERSGADGRAQRGLDRLPSCSRPPPRKMSNRIPRQLFLAAPPRPPAPAPTGPDYALPDDMDGPTCEEGDDIVHRHRAGARIGLARDRPDMRQQDDIVELAVGVGLGRQRLLQIDIETRPP